MRTRLYGWLVLPPAAWLLVLYAIPLLVVVAISFGTTDILGNPVFGWNPGNYSSVLTHAIVSPFAHSILYAAAATGISLAIGYPAAYTIARHGGRMRHALLALILLPWFVDYLVRIYAWLVILGDQGFVNDVLRAVGFGGDP